MRAAVTALLLAGCATAPADLSSLPDLRVCAGTRLAPTYDRQQQYRAELERRGAACTEQMIAQQIALDQAEQERRMAAARALQRGFEPVKPYQMPIPQQTNCTTTMIGNTAHTTCR